MFALTFRYAVCNKWYAFAAHLGAVL